MNWPAFTLLPTVMPGARRQRAGFLPSSVPGVSLLMWMYQYSQPSLPTSESMFPAVPLLSRCPHAIVPQLAATSCISLAPQGSLPLAPRGQLRAGRGAGAHEQTGHGQDAGGGAPERGRTMRHLWIPLASPLGLWFRPFRTPG